MEYAVLLSYVNYSASKHNHISFVMINR